MTTNILQKSRKLQVVSSQGLEEVLGKSIIGVAINQEDLQFFKKRHTRTRRIENKGIFSTMLFEVRVMAKKFLSPVLVEKWNLHFPLTTMSNNLFANPKKSERLKER